MKLQSLLVATVLGATPAESMASQPSSSGAGESFAGAATAAHERQVLQGRLAPVVGRDAAAAPPLLAASFAAAGPARERGHAPMPASVSPVPEPNGLRAMLAGLAAVLIVLARRARRDA